MYEKDWKKQSTVKIKENLKSSIMEHKFYVSKTDKPIQNCNYLYIKIKTKVASCECDKQAVKELQKSGKRRGIFSRLMLVLSS